MADAEVLRGLGLVASGVLHDTLQQRRLNLAHHHAVEIAGDMAIQVFEIALHGVLHAFAQRFGFFAVDHGESRFALSLI